MKVSGHARVHGARLAAAAAATVLWIAPAAAQDRGAPPPSETDSAGSQFGDIVVTAQRRDETVQDSTVAITALDGAALLASGRVDLDSALVTVPSVRITNTPTGSQVFIRGVGPAVTTDPAVSINVDGIYQSDGTFGRVYDVSRIEVLRGPQGTLYGRNATGGSVNFITNAPEFDNSVAGAIQVGNLDAFRTEAMVNVAPTDSLALRFAFLRNRRDGYFSNGSAADDTVSGRLRLRFRPSDALDIVVTGSHTEGDGTRMGTTPLPLGADPYRITTPSGRQVINRSEAYAEVNADLGFARLTWLPSYYRDRTEYGQDVRNIGLTAGGGVARQHTQELRLASLPDARLEWVVGGFYLRRDYNLDRQKTIPGGGAYRALVYPLVDTRIQDAESYAVFAEATVPLTERFKLTGGIRYSDETKSVTAIAYTARYVESTTIPRKSGEAHDTAVTWKVAAAYDLSPRNLVYAQVSTGFKAGGVNEARESPVAGAIVLGTTYRPEKLTAYELGSKNEFGPIQLNLAAYYYDYTDQHILNVLPGVVTVREVLNAAASTVYGAELEGQVRLARNTRFYGSLAYIHSQYDRFSYFNSLNPVFLPGSGTTVDYAGRSGTNAPKWSGSAGLEQRLRFGDGSSITASGELRFFSRYLYALEATPVATQPAYTQSDARITYATPGNRFSLTAFVNNIEDEAVRSFAVILGPPASLVQRTALGPPRTYGLRLAAQF